jgi:hypothetical protein
MKLIMLEKKRKGGGGGISYFEMSEGGGILS